jgi:hypothetical protein
LFLDVAILSNMAQALELRTAIVTLDVRGPFGNEEFKGYLAFLDRMLERAEPFVLIVEGSAIEPRFPVMHTREWVRTRAWAIQQTQRGIAFVRGSDIDGERLRMLCSMQPPGIPYAFVDSMDEAVELATDWLDAEPQAVRNRRPTMPMPAIR